MSSLNSARDSSREVTIKSNLRNSVILAEDISMKNQDSLVDFCSNQSTLDYIASIENSGGQASCFVHSHPGLRDDWAISASYKGVHFSVNSMGVIKFDSSNSGSTSGQGLVQANTLCATQSKRLPTISQLKALYNITGEGPMTPPSGFNQSTYWSSTSSQATGPWAISMFSGGIANGYFQNDPLLVRCVS